MRLTSFASQLPIQIPEKSYNDKTLSLQPEQFNPQDLVVYLSLQTVTATVPNLLGIDDQLVRINDQEDADTMSIDLGPNILFQGGIGAVTWAQFQWMQHTGHNEHTIGIRGKWSGVESPLTSAAVLDMIDCPRGFTRADLCAIDDALHIGKGRARELYQ